MSAITTFAVLTTGIAIGAAGHIALSTSPEGSQAAAVAAPAAHASSASRPEALPVAIAATPQVQDVALPRECRPQEGITTDCTYE